MKLFASTLILLALTSCVAFADRLQDDLIPPEVLPSKSSGSSSGSSYSGGTASATVAPGTTGAAAAHGDLSKEQVLWPFLNPDGKDKAPGAPPEMTDTTPDPVAVLTTSKGQISIRLFKKYAPKTVAHFEKLCLEGFYNNTIFHRVEKGFCIQGGDPNGNGSGHYTDPKTGKDVYLAIEISPYLKHNAPGVVAMARFPKNPNTASCQFYITLAPQTKLDGSYTIFGGVVAGMDVVNKIEKGDKIESVAFQK